MTDAAPVSILLVEDDPRDVELARAAFKMSGVEVHLEVAGDGDACLALLRDAAPEERPNLILLDLNMPRMDGRETLRELKNDPELRRIPVVVLTTSDDEADIRQVYDLQAACYVVKPVDFPDFIDALRALEGFWGRFVTFPQP